MRGLAWLVLPLLTPAAISADRALHDRAIVVDPHSDCTQRITYDGVDLAKPQPDMRVDLPKMKQGGLDAEFFSIFVGPWQTQARRLLRRGAEAVRRRPRDDPRQPRSDRLGAHGGRRAAQRAARRRLGALRRRGRARAAARRQRRSCSSTCRRSTIAARAT